MSLTDLLCALSLIIQLVVVVASTAPVAAAAAALKREDCNPKPCGELIVRYPFWLSGEQPSECGYPSFNVTCSGNRTASLNFFDSNYRVNDIFYHNQSLVLSASQFADNSCRLPYYNLTSDNYPLFNSASNKRIIFFLNCTSSKNSSQFHQVDCALYGRHAFYGGEYDPSSDQPNSAALGGCVPAVVPVVNYSNTSRDANYTVPLRDGWLMNWNVQNCTECFDSGGACGYENSTASFICICDDRNHKGTCKDKSSGNRNRIVIGSAAAGVITLTLLAIVLFCMYKKKHKYSASSKSLMPDDSFGTNMTKDSEMNSMNFRTHVFTYKELQEATNFFDASKELGDGGFGTVYRGELRDGRIVAVKRLYENSYRRIEQFMNEVGILSQLHHPNLVNLYGAHHSRELLLVYEFVSNGTIADHLHGSRASEALLTWPMRLNIAIETADAIRYLHAVEPPIIHRDIKSNNILLDGNFHVKVADFGLSRLFPDNVTHVSTAPQGTPGYLDPEYHQCYQLTDKSDVYSFGVVLVELISSKPAVDITRHRSEINLANLAINRIQNGEIDQLADPNLGYHSNRAVRKMMTMAAELAFRCLQTDGDMRPPIKEVLEVLRSIEVEGCNVEKEGDDDDARTRDDRGLLKNVPPFSPDSVMHEWVSRSTTPNTSV